MKEFNYEQELAELKEEVQDLLDEIEELEDEIYEKEHEERINEALREDCANGLKQMSILFDEAEKVGMSKSDVMTMLAIFAPKQ